MNERIERIPIPAAQRWENLRERILPAICLAATLAACAWLWQLQGRVAPFVHGEVGSEIVEVRSPHDGRLLPLVDQPDGQWPLFATIGSGGVAARLERQEGEPSVVELASPLSGVVTTVVRRPGQWVARGETILAIASPKPTFITCHVPDGSQPPEPGSEVAVRLRGAGRHWVAAEIEAVGPIVSTATVYDGASGGASVRGLPVRISIPPALNVKPGTLVDVRFPPSRPL
jgi:hypothetical protein